MKKTVCASVVMAATFSILQLSVATAAVHSAPGAVREKGIEATLRKIDERLSAINVSLGRIAGEAVGPKITPANISIDNIIGVGEIVALVGTLIFMIISFRRTDRNMLEQLRELRTEIKRATHDDLFDKIFGLYRLYIDHADDLSTFWSPGKPVEASEIKRLYLALHILDLLYLMHLHWDTLDVGLQKTWYGWVDKVFEQPELGKVYDSVRNEYDQVYISKIETYRKGRQPRT